MDDLATILNKFIEINLGKCESCNFNLRALTKTDLQFFVSTRNKVRNLLHNPMPYTMKEAEIWLKNLSVSQYLVILSKDKRYPIGYFRFNLVDHANLQVGLDLDPKKHGQGIGTLLYQCLLSHWEYPSPIKKLSLRVLSHNEIAHQLYLKVGFKERSRRSTNHIGMFVDDIYMEIDLN